MKTMKKKTNGRQTQAQALLARLDRAYQGLRDGTYVVRASPDGYYVSNGLRTYEVSKTNGKEVCSCPDFQKRNLRCKHIFMVYLSYLRYTRGMSLEAAREYMRRFLQKEAPSADGKPPTDGGDGRVSLQTLAERVEALSQAVAEIRALLETLMQTEVTP